MIIRKYSHLLYMSIIGFFSAVPMYFLVSTIVFFGKEKGFCAKKIAWIALMTFPYALKVLISIILNYFRDIIWIKKFGFYRFWALSAQTMIVVLFYKGPDLSTLSVMLWVFSMALCSTVLDCVLESYRIESTSVTAQSSASGANAFGWRLGSWLVSYMPLMVSYYWGWDMAIHCLFLLSLLGLIAFLFLRSLSHMQNQSFNQEKTTHVMGHSFWMGLMSFQKNTYFNYVIFMILSYKIGDVFLHHMMGCYLVDMGGSVHMIAQIDKGVGVISTLMGVFLCSLVIHKKNIQKGFIVWLWGKSAVSFLFFIHAFCFFHCGVKWSINVLWFLDTISHFVGGIGSTALLSYFAFLCKKQEKNTMICYGIVSSISALGRTLASGFAGYMADILNTWPLFFVMSSIVLIPAFFVMHHKRPFIVRDDHFIL